MLEEESAQHKQEKVSTMKRQSKTRGKNVVSLLCTKNHFAKVFPQKGRLTCLVIEDEAQQGSNKRQLEISKEIV
jgi:hypothetical protein